MAKTKVQKQQEAIERKRKHLNRVRQNWIDVAYGTATHRDNAERYGLKFADDVANQARMAYLRLCRECNVDDYGNPIKEG